MGFFFVLYSYCWYVRLKREVRRDGTEDKVLQMTGTSGRTETETVSKTYTDGLKTTACGGHRFTNLNLWYLNSVTRHFNCFKDMK